MSANLEFEVCNLAVRNLLDILFCPSEIMATRNDMAVSRLEMQFLAVLTSAIAKNSNRRHINETQRAWAASGFVNTEHGGDRKSEDQEANLHLDPSARTVERMANDFSVGERSVKTARSIRRAIEDKTLLAGFADEIRKGRIAVSAAEQCIRQDKGLQMNVLENPECRMAS